MMFNVLVAEPGDEGWSFIAHAIRRRHREASILRVKDGEQAVRFLFDRGLLTDEPELVNLVVLAGNLPRIPSESVIARLRETPRTSNTPVIVVSRPEGSGYEAAEPDGHEWLARQQALLIVGQQNLERDVAEAIHRLCGNSRLPRC